MRFLGRLFVGSLALALAIPCGALVLGAGVLLDPVSRDVLGRLGLYGLLSGLSDIAAGLPPEVAVSAAVAFVQALFVLLAVPPSLVALVGETLGLRTLAWYCGASGFLTAVLPWLARGGAGRPQEQAALAAEGRVVGILFLTGAASGLVYWAIAGRDAGPSRAVTHAG